MFTKEELLIISAFLSSDINVPVKFAKDIVLLKEKVDNELKSYDTTTNTTSSETTN